MLHCFSFRGVTQNHFIHLPRNLFFFFLFSEQIVKTCTESSLVHPPPPKKKNIYTLCVLEARGNRLTSVSITYILRLRLIYYFFKLLTHLWGQKTTIVVNFPSFGARIWIKDYVMFLKPRHGLKSYLTTNISRLSI